MITLSAPYCTHLPEHARITLFSGEFVKTVIVTLQGTQAIVALGLALSGSRDSSDGFITFMGVDLIFFPLAFIGLVRLFCAFWLTDDFAYSLSRRGSDSIEDAPQPKDGDTRISMDSLLDGGSHEPNLREARFLPTSYWGSRAVRAVSLLPILGLLVMCVLFLIQPGGGKQFTLTAFLVALFYLIFLAATLVICSYYFIRGETSTTILCLGSKAYKIYTGVLIGMAIAVFVSACVQTRRTACGRWTSAPYEAGDFGICSDSKRPDVIRFDFNKYPDFGLATTQPARDLENNTFGEGEFWVRNFTGTCLGTLGSTVVKHASTLELVDLEELEKTVPPNYSL